MIPVYPWRNLKDNDIDYLLDRLNISMQTMRHYLSGRRKPSVKRARAIEEIMQHRKNKKSRLTAAEILGV